MTAKSSRINELISEPRMGPGTTHNQMNSIEGLIDLCSAIPKASNLRMVEIGSFLGVSTEVFCMHFNHVSAVDIWGLNLNYGEANRSLSITELSWDQVKRRCESRLAPYSNSTIIHNFSEIAVNEFEDKSLDFVYIDGNHGSAHDDVEMWLPKIRSTGFIGGHDIHLVRQLLKSVSGLDSSDIISFKDTSWLKKL